MVDYSEFTNPKTVEKPKKYKFSLRSLANKVGLFGLILSGSYFLGVGGYGIYNEFTNPYRNEAPVKRALELTGEKCEIINLKTKYNKQLSDLEKDGSPSTQQVIVDSAKEVNRSLDSLVVEKEKQIEVERNTPEFINFYNWNNEFVYPCLPKIALAFPFFIGSTVVYEITKKQRGQK